MKITIFDTTLRDGSQTEGVSYTVKDKLKITEKLDELGVHYIEGGWPGSNPKDQEYFKAVKGKKYKSAKIVAFGSTRRAKTTPSKDANIKALVASGAKHFCIFGKTWDLHVTDVIKTTLDENLKMISDSVKYLKKKGETCFYDAEHFFDGFKNNPEYALSTVMAAQAAGADAIVFCDTNGGTMPHEVREIIASIQHHFQCSLGIHCHHDLELGVANSISAVRAGCDHVQGTFNGLGERCGNANLATVIGILDTKLNVESIPKKNLSKLMETAYFISEISNSVIPNNAAFVGHSAFAHKGGVHIDAMMKNPLAYEHVNPKRVGNQSRFITSELAGKMPIVKMAAKLNVKLDKKSPEARQMMQDLQDKEHGGYQFEAADASFELFMKRQLKKYKPFYTLDGFHTHSQKDKDGNVQAEATVNLTVKKKAQTATVKSTGPVEAMDKALRQALTPAYPELEHMHLVDYKVRVIDTKGGTSAKVRVFIESQDDHESWTTVGVHENIIEASWEALTDAIEFKLLKDKK